MKPGEYSIERLRQMPKFILLFVVSICAVFYSPSINAQTIQKNDKDPCEQINILLTSSDPVKFTLADVYKSPQCFNGRFIRLVGVYRIAFENSDLYDPTGDDSSWLTFDPFYPAIKRCSAPEALKLLGRKNGGTFGIVAMGVINARGRYGHLGGWTSEFQMICLEEIKVFSESGFVFQAQAPKVQKQIIDWYAKKSRR